MLGGETADGRYAEPSPYCSACILLVEVSTEITKYSNIMKVAALCTWGLLGLGSRRSHAEWVSTSPGLFL